MIFQLENMVHPVFKELYIGLKMAELDLLSKTLNVPPILILDDVLAELDLTRQNLLNLLANIVSVS